MATQNIHCFFKSGTEVRKRVKIKCKKVTEFKFRILSYENLNLKVKLFGVFTKEDPIKEFVIILIRGSGIFCNTINFTQKLHRNNKLDLEILSFLS